MSLPRGMSAPPALSPFIATTLSELAMENADLLKARVASGSTQWDTLEVLNTQMSSARHAYMTTLAESYFVGEKEGDFIRDTDTAETRTNKATRMKEEISALQQQLGELSSRGATVAEIEAMQAKLQQLETELATTAAPLIREEDLPVKAEDANGPMVGLQRALGQLMACDALTVEEVDTLIEYELQHKGRTNVAKLLEKCRRALTRGQKKRKAPPTGGAGRRT